MLWHFDNPKNALNHYQNKQLLHKDSGQNPMLSLMHQKSPGLWQILLLVLGYKMLLLRSFLFFTVRMFYVIIDSTKLKRIQLLQNGQTLLVEGQFSKVVIECF